MERVKKYHPTAHYTGYQEGYHNFNYTDRTEECSITKRIHEGTNRFYCIERSNDIYLKCHSQHCKNSIHIGHLDEFIESAIQVIAQYLLESPQMNTILEDRYTNKKVLAIKSPMGTGKTTMIKEILNNVQFKTVLWITPRQTLTKSTFGSFKDCSFVNYMDEKGCLYKMKKVIVQIDSLMRMVDRNEFVETETTRRYDLVIVDEIVLI